MSSSPLPEPRADVERLRSLLERARELGFLGPGPIEVHLDNAAAFAAAAPDAPQRALDLGSGGGVPGLALALWWPASRWVLLDAMARRSAFLRSAIDELDLGERVEVCQDRAEQAGRDPDLRSAFDLVTARGFGRPPVTAECAAPFLVIGGVLLVSDPPEGGARWEGVAALGLEDLGVASRELAHIRRLELVTPCPERYPRRVGVPDKRPLW